MSFLCREALDDFDDENAEPDIYEDDDQKEDVGGGEDPDGVEHDQNGPNNVVVGGDPSAAAAAKTEQKNTVKNMKEKRVPNEKRTTTPYMTKYERARVLGTRALQIRWGFSSWNANWRCAPLNY
jgi:DNA-directed RNA polymerase I, II, and III subunit RPABC2